ncbi:MAG: ATP-binding cassette domain-containing protein [Defluviitaleaceae bacterium]|nr:ATP-binding cassette domain-containing protein [Defluviitaleaceae bacterium]
MAHIEVNHITKDYGHGQGIFDLNLEIAQGEVFGFVGTNGAGKTTTIRHMMGFIKPDKGNSQIKGLDCWRNSAKVKKYVGYIPGEIAFPDAPTGTEFLRRQAQLLGLKDMTYAHRIIDILQLDPTANLKRMSKGMKQKTAITAAFMADPEILILDEPTTGLDPLMRVGFVDLINEEKKKGKTIFMSTHLFEEVENTCDKVALIKDGKIIAIKSTAEIRHNQDKSFKIEFLSHEDYLRFTALPFIFEEKRESQSQVVVQVNDKDINPFLETLKSYPIKFLRENKYTLEQYFNNLYRKGQHNV